MKVLQVINSLGTGGAEKLLLDTLPLYNNKGIEMDILLLWDNECMFTKQLQQLACCRVFILKKSGKIRDIYNPLLIFKIAKIIKDYEVVHVHLFPAQYFVVCANWINKKRSILLFTEHSTSNTRMVTPVLSKLDRYLYKGYSKIIAISEGVKTTLALHIREESKIILVLNGVNIAKVKDAPISEEVNEMFTDKNIKLLIHIGGFRTQKDQDTSIRALRHLPCHFHLVLVGDGERRERLETLVSVLSLEERVHFLGVRNDVFSILKSSYVVIVSSHFEGFGLAAIEGMAASKPVIASNVSGLSEIVKGAGILFEVGQDQQLATEVLKLTSDNAYYNTLVQKGLERAVEYDIHNMVDKHIRIYTSFAKI